MQILPILTVYSLHIKRGNRSNLYNTIQLHIILQNNKRRGNIAQYIRIFIPDDTHMFGLIVVVVWKHLSDKTRYNDMENWYDQQLVVDIYNVQWFVKNNGKQKPINIFMF